MLAKTVKPATAWREAKKLFCFRSDNKRTKSKRFAFVPIISGPNQYVLLRSISFWIKWKCHTLPKTISRPNQKLLCFVPEFLGQNENDLLATQFFMYQIKMFCFRSESEQTKSKHFAFVPIISIDIETFVLSFQYR
jgi:hypothetical protein